MGHARVLLTVTCVALVAAAAGAVLPAQAAAAVASADRAPAGAWRWPVARGDVLRAFSIDADRFAAGQHRGADLAAPQGSPVRSSCSGTVSFAGSVPGGGRTISVHCGRLVATYQHLGAIDVRRGAVVVRGARLGAVGRSGRPRLARAHVHLGVREASSGRYLDPLALLDGGAGPPATVPPGDRARRVPPLGRAPARPAAPARVPRPVPTTLPHAGPGPSPARVPVVAPAPLPTSVRGPAPLPDAPRLPWTTWAGLALAGLGLPIGGLVRVRRRRRCAAATTVRTA